MNGMSYGDLIDELDSCWKRAGAPNDKHSDEYWVRDSSDAKNILAGLDLMETGPAAEKKQPPEEQEDR